MHKGTMRFMSLGVAVSLALAIATRCLAAENETPAPVPAKTEVPAKNPGAEKKVTAYPFQGIIAGVDKTAMSITLEGKAKPRVLLVTSQTRFKKGEQSAVFEEVVAGEEIAGQLVKTADGKEEAVMLRLGPKAKPAPKMAKKSEK